MVTQSTNTLLQAECADVLRRNRALAIYAKTVFNPNASYVSEFDNGKLFEPSPYLYYLPFTYMSYRDVSLPMNQYYLFNSQIPATL